MPVLLFNNIYAWLRKIGVFKAEPIKTKNESVCEVPYDEQIYLQNGYLIGVTLRKFIKPYSPQYQELLQIRKIATLKSSQNWQIIEPYLNRIGCNSITDLNQNDDEVQIQAHQIAEILQFLYEEYSPKQQQRLKMARRIRNNYVDIYNFNPSKPLNQTGNSIELVCILLVRNFKITLGEALGLLMEKSKYLKKLIVEGSKKDEFESVVTLFKDFINGWSILRQFFCICPKELEKVLEGVSEGVVSEKKEVVHLALNLLSLVEDEEWFMNYGYYKLLRSEYIQCFFFTIQRLSPHYDKILNQNLHVKITDKLLLFTILYNLLKAAPKTIYAKQIFTAIPLTYFYEQCYSVLNSDDIDDQPPKLVIKAKQLLAKLMTTFVDKIPNAYAKRILETFKYNGNRSYGETYFNLGLLFEILEVMMLRECPLLEKFFKICMKHWSSTFGETRHWIIQNLRQLYQKMGKCFPLGCMLALYPLDSVAQPDQYCLFLEISQDRSSLSRQQSTLTIGCLIKYIQSQLHCKCFLAILKLFISNHPKSSTACIEQTCMQLLKKMQQINIPMLNQGEINILNPKPPLKNRVVHSIGMKRKEMMKFAQYELCKQLLEIFGTLKDKQYLLFYANALSHAINEIEKQIGHRKKQLVALLKQMRRRAKRGLDQLHEPQPMSQIVKSIALNRSTISYGISNQHFTPQHTPLSESKLLPDNDLGVSSQFERILNPKTGQHSIIKQQDEQESENQFIPDHPPTPNPSNYENLLQTNYSPNLEANQNGFTGEMADNQNIYIFSNSVLEQFQIAYINLAKQKYERLIRFCTQIYNSLSKNATKPKDYLAAFLASIGVSPFVDIQMAEPILIKCKTFSPTISDLVLNFLLQTSFHLFAFNPNRRVTITCVISFFTIIEEYLNQHYEKFRMSQKIGGSVLNKNMEFQYRIGAKLRGGVGNLQKVTKKRIQSYIVCFELLSQILNDKFSLHLVQPFSKQVNQFPSTFSQPISNKSQEFKTSGKSEHLSQIEMLEQLLEQSEEPSQNVEPAGQRVKRTGKKATKQESLVKIDSTSVRSNKQLRGKLAKRLKLLNEDLAKTGRNLGKLIEKELEIIEKGDVRKEGGE